jgi:pimeloyl-ACP methyl ester carboxylesterase
VRAAGRNEGSIGGSARKRLRSISAVILAMILTAVAVIVVQSLEPPDKAPAGQRALHGVLNGAEYDIRLPQQWNGSLIVVAHGYRNRADHPTEPTRPRPAEPVLGPVTVGRLLAKGYAVASSAYRLDGWAVAEATEDLKRLVELFRTSVGEPRSTLLVGLSMGSVVALQSAEQDGPYDGALAVCSIGAGTTGWFDSTLAVALAYDAVFGWPADWGTPYDLHDELNFETDVLPVLRAHLSRPGGAARLELVRILARVPRGPEWPNRVLSFATEYRAELERRAGGPVAQNLGHQYAVPASERSRLGLPAHLVDAAVARMNAHRFGPGAGRPYAERHAAYTGRLKHPVMTLTNAVDALVPAAQVDAYARTVGSAGAAGQLVTAWTNGKGHCAFSPAQMVRAIDALDRWVRAGIKPGAFPRAEGFSSRTPPTWPFP